MLKLIYVIICNYLNIRRVFFKTILFYVYFIDFIEIFLLSLDYNKINFKYIYYLTRSFKCILKIKRPIGFKNQLNLKSKLLSINQTKSILKEYLGELSIK